MKVTVRFTNFNKEEFVMEGPNVDYAFIDGYLVVTSDCFSEKPEKRVTFDANKVFCVVEENGNGR